MGEAARTDSVGFVGLGMMGMPMARNILKSGHRVVACDIDAARPRQLAASGAVAVADPAAVARQASLLISMVETTSQTEEVVFGSNGFLQAARPGDIVVVMSTLEFAALRGMHERLARHGIALLDAPVTGMRDNGGAQAASLKCYVGGDAQALERARPVLRTMTSEITHFGAIGLGTAMKLVNNMLMQVNRVVIAEGLAAGAKAGLDPRQMIDTIAGSTGNSVAFQYNAPRMLDRDFDGIRMDITTKDVALEVAFGNSIGVPMVMASAALQMHQMAKAMGLGDRDAAALIQVYEQFTGVPVTPRA